MIESNFLFCNIQNLDLKEFMREYQRCMEKTPYYQHYQCEAEHFADNLKIILRFAHMNRYGYAALFEDQIAGFTIFYPINEIQNNKKILSILFGDYRLNKLVDPYMQQLTGFVFEKTETLYVMATAVVPVMMHTQLQSYLVKKLTDSKKYKHHDIVGDFDYTKDIHIYENLGFTVLPLLDHYVAILRR